MDNNEKMVVVYNLGNFHDGKFCQTDSKETVNAFEKIGYKLISVSFIKLVTWLDSIKL